MKNQFPKYKIIPLTNQKIARSKNGTRGVISTNCLFHLKSHEDNPINNPTRMQ